MKPVYSNILLKSGAHVAGIVLIKIAPREWITTIIEKDFNTSKVIIAVSFIAGKDWITLELAPKSYEYNDKPNSNKAGTFRQISASGIINNYNPDVQQVLETLRYHDHVLLVLDKNKRIRIVGNTDAGMALTYEPAVKNNLETVQIGLTMDAEFSPPYYEV